MPISKKNTAPRPLPERECDCGCGIKFNPNRIDQKFLNKQHADFAYNNTIRKRKSAERVRQEKILHKNDRIIAKYVKFDRFKTYCLVYYDVLLAEGYDFAAHFGIEESEDGVYYFTYNYMFTIVDNVPKQVKIRRRK